MADLDPEAVDALQDTAARIARAWYRLPAHARVFTYRGVPLGLALEAPALYQIVRALTRHRRESLRRAPRNSA